MTKTKRQLRAEAVERLKEYHDWETHQKSLANITLAIWPMSTDMSNDKRVDALIDLLTDDDSTTESLSDEPDSREKLEADVYKAAEEMEEFTHGEKFINTNKILRWLDRQEAITAREYCWADDALQEELDRVRDERDHLRRQVDMLNEQVIELTAQRDEYREKFGKALDLAHAIGELMP